MSPLKIQGPIRIRSMQTGITKWKEGSFEIVEKENKVSLVVHYNIGGIPRIFQVFQILIWNRSSSTSFSELLFCSILSIMVVPLLDQYFLLLIYRTVILLGIYYKLFSRIVDGV